MSTANNFTPYSAERSVTSHVTAQRLVATVAAGGGGGYGGQQGGYGGAGGFGGGRRQGGQTCYSCGGYGHMSRTFSSPFKSPSPTNRSQVTVPKAKSATTAAKSAISRATAHPRTLAPSELATSASNPATFKPSAPTKQKRMMNTKPWIEAERKRDDTSYSTSRKTKHTKFRILRRINKRYPEHLERVVCCTA